DPPDVDRYQSASYPASIYRQASQWLSARGITIDPAEFSGTAIAAGVPPFRIDAIAFSVSDLDAAVDWLRARGETPATRSDDTAPYRLSRALPLEIVPETDRPDAYWCPMPLDVRSPSAGKCPICGMDLVAIPPPKLGSYRLDVAIKPARH